MKYSISNARIHFRWGASNKNRHNSHENKNAKIYSVFIEFEAKIYIRWAEQVIKYSSRANSSELSSCKNINKYYKCTVMHDPKIYESCNISFKDVIPMFLLPNKTRVKKKNFILMRSEAVLTCEFLVIRRRRFNITIHISKFFAGNLMVIFGNKE